MKGKPLSEALDKFKTKRDTFYSWLQNDELKNYIESVITFEFLQSKMIIAEYTVTAAIKLISLIESDKPETARKACLDILKGPAFYKKDSKETGPDSSFPNSRNDKSVLPMSQETQNRILSALADEVLPT